MARRFAVQSRIGGGHWSYIRRPDSATRVTPAWSSAWKTEDAGVAAAVAQRLTTDQVECRVAP